MDRQTVYPGSIPLETDLLNTNLNTMISIGRLAGAVVGTATQVTGLPCTPTSPASMQVSVGSGDIYSLQNIDNTPYSSLPANTAVQIVKQGILLYPITLSCPAPATVGQSINYLVQATYQDQDNNPVVLPYYNPSNPSVAWSGAANSGIAQPTVRQGVCVVTVVAGTAATTGSQTTPSVSSGNVPLYVVTVPYGATTITSGMIATAPGAPFLAAPGTVAATTGIAGVAKLASRAEAEAGTNATDIVTPDGLGQTLIANNWGFCTAGGTANALTGSIIPNPAALAAGVSVSVLATATNTGAATFNLNGLGAAAIQVGGSALTAGQIASGSIVKLTYDGTHWQMTNAATVATATTTTQGIVQIAAQSVVNAGTNATQTVASSTLANAIQNNTFLYGAASGTANALTVTLTPAPAALTAGQVVFVKIASNNTGAATLNVNGLGVAPITQAGSGLSAGTLIGGQIYAFVYDGTSYEMIGGLSGIVPQANGGTGAVSLAAAGLPTVSGNNTFTGQQALAGTSSTIAAVLTNAAEVTTVSATAANGTVNFYVGSQSILQYTSNASANWTLNVAMSSGTTLNTALAIGQTITIAFKVPQGSTAYYMSAFTIDGVSVTPQWQGGTAPSAGHASSTDVYTFSITKTASATYSVLASQTQFA